MDHDLSQLVYTRLLDGGRFTLTFGSPELRTLGNHLKTSTVFYSRWCEEAIISIHVLSTFPSITIIRVSSGTKLKTENDGLVIWAIISQK